jgi:hypothetical protein
MSEKLSNKFLKSNNNKLEIISSLTSSQSSEVTEVILV